MKKKILVVFTGSMEIGGIERSLLGLLDSIDYERFEVDLFLYAHHGPLFGLINSNVNILPEVKELSFLRESFFTKVKNGCFYSALLRLRDQIVGRVKTIYHDETWAQVMRKCAPKLNNHYDVALGFFRPFDFIIEKVNADIKVGWVHTDYTMAGEALSVLKHDYSRMDYIAAVSDKCGESFKQLFPELANKVIVIENILSKSFIKGETRKIEVSTEMDGSIKLLSIGRFSNAKNFDNVPDICKRIRENGLDVKWYLIGYGNEEDLIRKRIRESDMQNHVIILGKKDNPYPYIEACDLYVQPSRYEGKCVAVREAQMLGKPVVITNYPTASSQLENGVDGVIVPNDNCGCANGIARLIEDKELMDKLSYMCSLRDYSNYKELEKIYHMLNE